MQHKIYVCGLEAHGKTGVSSLVPYMMQKERMELKCLNEFASALEHCSSISLKSISTRFSASTEDIEMKDGVVSHDTDERSDSHSYKKQLLKHSIQYITCADSFTLFLRSDNKIVGMGRNEDGSLGIGADFCRDISVPHKMISSHLLSPIQQVEAAGGHTCVLLENGTVYTCGINYFMQLGIENVRNTKILTPISYTNLFPARKIGCSGCSTLIQTDDLKTYVLGTTKGYESKIIEFPCLRDLKMKKMSGNYEHLVFLTECGKLFVYGKLANFLMLSNGNQPLELTNHPYFFKNEIIVDVCISRKYLICLSKTNRLYIFNDNNNQVFKTIDLSHGKGLDCCQITCSNTLILLLQRDGTVVQISETGSSDLRIQDASILVTNLRDKLPVKMLNLEKNLCLPDQEFSMIEKLQFDVPIRHIATSDDHYILYSCVGELPVHEKKQVKFLKHNLQAALHGNHFCDVQLFFS